MYLTDSIDYSLMIVLKYAKYRNYAVLKIKKLRQKDTGANELTNLLCLVHITHAVRWHHRWCFFLFWLFNNSGFCR